VAQFNNTLILMPVTETPGIGTVSRDQLVVTENGFIEKVLDRIGRVLTSKIVDDGNEKVIPRLLLNTSQLVRCTKRRVRNADYTDSKATIVEYLISQPTEHPGLVKDSERLATDRLKLVVDHVVVALDAKRRARV
jgi:hypothetical protein